jgi:hypothetical protein
MEAGWFRCTSCNYALEYTADHAGAPFQCPQCGVHGTIPVMPGEQSSTQFQELKQSPAPTSSAESRDVPTSVTPVTPIVKQEDLAPRPDAAAVLPSVAPPRVEVPDVKVEGLPPAVAELMRNWRQVRTGINLISGAVILPVALAVPAFFCNVLVGLFTSPYSNPEAMTEPSGAELIWRGTLWLLVGVLAVRELLTSLGLYLCLAVPGSSRKWLATGALILGGIGLAWEALTVVVIGKMQLEQQPFAENALVLGLVVGTLNVLLFSRWLIVLFWLRSVADALSDRDLAQSIYVLMGVAGVAEAAFLAVLAVFTALGDQGQFLGLREVLNPMAWVVGLCTLALLVWYVRILRDVCNVIDAALARQ